MSSYNVEITHNFMVRGINEAQDVDEQLAAISAQESFTGVTSYQQLSASFHSRYGNPTSRYVRFDDLGMTRLALLIVTAPDSGNTPINRILTSTGDPEASLLTGRTMFLKFDNRLVTVTGDSDGFRFTVSGDNYSFDEDLYPSSGVAGQSVVDLVAGLNSAMDTADPGNPVTFSVGTNLGIRATVTGATGTTGHTIMARAPTGGSAVDIRVQLFGTDSSNGEDWSEDISGELSVFEGKIVSQYSPDEIQLEIDNTYGANNFVYVSVLVIGVT